MNAERLLQHYEQIADAPDAVARLRRFVLDLAVRGKLVPQDPADEPVSTALRQTNTRGWSDGAFTLPASWAWVDVAAVAEARLGKMLDKAKNKGVPRPYLRNINVRWFDFDLSDLQDMPFEDTELAEFALRAGDVLICEGGEPGRAAVWDERARGVYFQKAIHRVRFTQFVNSTFFAYALKASANDGRLAKSFTGTGIKHFTGKGLSGYRFPLPPLAEQHRIVAKIDELMALCDELEAARTEREVKRDRVAAASLARLSNPDPETFRHDARFALDALPALTARPDQIKQLRQTILNLAVRGKLVPQDAAEEPVKELLRRIEADRQMVRRKVETEGASKSGPFDLPGGWMWTTIGSVCSKTGSGSTPRGGKEVYADHGIPFLRSQNVHNDGLRLNDVAYIAPEVHLRMAGTAVKASDLLLNITGGSMGRCCLVPDQFGEANISQHVAIIRPVVSMMAHYLHCLVLSPYFQAFIFDEQTGAGRGGLPKNRMDQIAVPLPPLAEQHRIVSKVDELTALCDQLETSLASADETRKKLLNALLAEALAPVDAEKLREAAE